jgi:IS30 family transposase
MTELDFLKEQITKYKLDTNSRNRSYVYKRYYIMYRLNKCKVSLTQIGKMLNRHHATVIHGIRMHRRWSRQLDKVYLHEVEPLVQTAKDLNYQDKYKVSAVENLNYINVKIQMPWTHDKVYQFKEYMTAKELAEII